MVNKGKIIFVNGYWQSGYIGREIIGSSSPGEKYWGTKDGAFEKSAEEFFGIHEEQGTHVYLDGSSTIGIDMDGDDRFKKGLSDYHIFDENYFKTYIEKAEKNGIDASPNVRAVKKLNNSHLQKYNYLTDGMDKNRHVFYMITHSEGGGYGAGLAKFLIKQGWKVHTVVHLSTDEAQDFDTPPQPMTYQLGLSYNGSEDWVTGNYQIRNGVDKWGIVDDPTLSWKFVHGYTKNEEVFVWLKDLLIVTIEMVRKNSRLIWRQKPQRSINTKFSMVNGIRLNYTSK